MHTWSRRRSASPPRRSRLCLEALEERDLLAASMSYAPASVPERNATPPAQAAVLPADSTSKAASTTEADEYATTQATPVAATPTPSADTAARPQTAANANYDQYDWARAPRPAAMNSTASGQSAADVGAVAEAVRAQRKEIGLPDVPPPAAHGPSASTLGNDVLLLPVPSAALVAGVGVGFVSAAGGTRTEIEPDDPVLAGAIPLERLSAGGPDSAAVHATRVEDLTPHLGPVLSGNLLSGPGELAALAGRVSSFFSQLGSLENPLADAESSLGLAPWVVAVAVSAAALEYGRRRLSRPALVGPSARPSSWVRRGGGYLLSAEEMQ